MKFNSLIKVLDSCIGCLAIDSHSNQNCVASNNKYGTYYYYYNYYYYYYYLTFGKDLLSKYTFWLLDLSAINSEVRTVAIFVKFHIPVSRKRLVIVVKLKRKWKFRAAAMLLFHILQKKKRRPITILYFRAVYYVAHNSVCRPYYYWL
jgi:hypothetical protein